MHHGSHLPEPATPGGHAGQLGEHLPGPRSHDGGTQHPATAAEESSQMLISRTGSPTRCRSPRRREQNGQPGRQ